jgi:hypothetical protein
MFKFGRKKEFLTTPTKPAAGQETTAAPAPVKKTAPAREAALVKLAVFIIDWNKRQLIGDVFETAHVRFHFVAKGRGTASSEVLDMLGIGSIEKAVVFVLEQELFLPQLFRDVTRKLGLHNPGAGIAFTAPLSAINTPILSVFKQSVEKLMDKTMETVTEENKMDENDGKITIRYDLIVSIINQGYSDEFMVKAREAGAGGGTVISARALMHKGPVKFLGITVQDEKEIIIILSTREKRTGIMSTVSRAYGITTKAEGIIFSVPVDSITGVDLR